jgi:hypothetical protein
LGARPQSGLSAAGVLCELPVEGGITRFLAFYEDYAALPEVGPVRSSRDGFLQLAMPWQALLVCYGTSQMHDWYSGVFEVGERTLDYLAIPGVLARDEARLSGQAVENTAYANGTLLAGAIRAQGIDAVREYRSTFFNFVGLGEMVYIPGGDAATALRVPFSVSYQTFFDYDAGQNLYLMSQYSSSQGKAEPAVDLNNQRQLAYTNAVVLFAEMPVYASTGGLLDIRFGYGGVGYYFSYGRCERIRWKKDSPLHPLLLVDYEDGATPVRVNTGATYLAMMDVGRAADFAYGAGDTLIRLGDLPDTEGGKP